MMKNILKSLAIVAVVAIAGYNVSQSKVETEGMSDTMLANVEALASGEGSPLFDGNPCYGTMAKTCCKCGTKHYTYAYATSNSGRCTTESCSHY